MFIRVCAVRGNHRDILDRSSGDRGDCGYGGGTLPAAGYVGLAVFDGCAPSKVGWGMVDRCEPIAGIHKSWGHYRIFIRPGMPSAGSGVVCEPRTATAGTFAEGIGSFTPLGDSSTPDPPILSLR